MSLADHVVILREWLREITERYQAATTVEMLGLLDVADQLAAPLARDGDPEPIQLEKTATSFAIGWKGHHRIEGTAFIYADRDSGRVRTILGYPTQKIARAS